jgi:acyl-CoA thioesterase I
MKPLRSRLRRAMGLHRAATSPARLATLAGACALLFCGGLVAATAAAPASASASAPMATLRAAAPAGTVLIEAYGDSTTLGTSCSDHRCGPLAQNAVTWLQDALHDDFGTHVTVTNLGVGGSMASQLLDGICHGRCPTFAARMAVSSAQIVTFNYGINEVMQNQTPEQFYAAETALVKLARAAGKQPVLETSNPMPDPRRNAKLAAMVEMTRRVAAEQHVPLVDQYAYISGMPDWQMQMSDGAHPKPELYRLKARESYAVLDPLVRRLLHDAS